MQAPVATPSPGTRVPRTVAGEGDGVVGGGEAKHADRNDATRAGRGAAARHLAVVGVDGHGVQAQGGGGIGERRGGGDGARPQGHVQVGVACGRERGGGRGGGGGALLRRCLPRGPCALTKQGGHGDGDGGKGQGHGGAVVLPLPEGDAVGQRLPVHQGGGVGRGAGDGCGCRGGAGQRDLAVKATGGARHHGLHLLRGAQ
jgi:hypothetical protein